jgi:hypothetical protein
MISDFLNSPALLALALLVAGYFAVKAIRDEVAKSRKAARDDAAKLRKDAEEIHVLVDGRFSETLNLVEELQGEVEKLGGAKAPPTREESRDAADRQRH